MVDIHTYHRRLERSFVRVREATIPEANRKALLDFSRFCMADGISAGKLHRYLDDILSLTKNNKKEYLAYTRDDIETIIISCICKILFFIILSQRKYIIKISMKLSCTDTISHAET